MENEKTLVCVQEVKPPKQQTAIISAAYSPQKEGTQHIMFCKDPNVKIEQQ